MDNSNQFIHNARLIKYSSWMHLLDAISPDIENNIDLVQSSKYYDDENFKSSINSRLCILKPNCQSINARYEKLKMFLDCMDDDNTRYPISIICI